MGGGRETREMGGMGQGKWKEEQGKSSAEGPPLKPPGGSAEGSAEGLPLKPPGGSVEGVQWKRAARFSGMGVQAPSVEGLPPTL